jgi:hypothetical protein
MPATPSFMPGDPGFAARYPGICCRCGNRIDVSDLIAYDEDDAIYGIECCGDVVPDAEPFTAKKGVEPIRVMPTGKTKRDACSRCFIIHTTAQGDECE